jgi:hypothetical protein
LERVLDGEPVLSGRHPLHLYHGCLGARTLLRRGTLLCYDPDFHAGYPKTPVFDSGSRPAELLLSLVGGRYSPAVYKIGLAVFSGLVPLLLWLAARSIGLTRAAATLAVLLGLAVWWGKPCQDALQAGAVDVLLAGLLVLVQCGLLVRFHERPGVYVYLGVVLTGSLGWFVHPVLLAMTLPLFLIYYFSVGVRHHPVWHCALLGGLVCAIAANLFWLIDWVDYWWIRTPLQLDQPVLTEASWENVWHSAIWGEKADRLLAAGLVLTAAFGVVAIHKKGRRYTAGLLGMGFLGCLLLARAGLIWVMPAAMGSPRLLPVALLFAAPAAAYFLAGGIEFVGERTGWPGFALASLVVFVPAALLAGWQQQPVGVPFPAGRTSTLQIGLGPERRTILEQIHTHTTAEARILWEDRRTSSITTYWTALLPLLSERSFVGGLDPQAGIEHTQSGLRDQILAGKPLTDWTDDQLMDYCDRYNIGWVVCWTPGSIARFEAWPAASSAAPIREGNSVGRLFKVDRYPSYALLGTAEWLHADHQGIILGDVVPHQGRVVLSLHYQAGLRAIPGRVRVEPELDPSDPIPLVRLLMDEPVARVTLIWTRR